MVNKVVNKLFKELSYQTGQYVVAPEFLSLIITMRCNFRCQSCSIWQKPVGEELDEASWQKIVEKLSKTLKPETFVEINGGEPLIRKELTLFLIKELKKYFHTVALNSNGLLLDEETLDQLKQAGLDLIKISFYSLNAEIHNNLRGHDLAYDHAKKAIELINQKKIALEVGILITSQNIKEAPTLIEYLQMLPNTNIILQPLDEKIESAEAKNPVGNKLLMDLWPAKKEVDSFFEWVLQNNQKIKNSTVNIKAIQQYYLDPASILKYRCFAGQRNLVVQPNGEVAFCFKHGAIGNLVQQDLDQILKKATTERKKIKNCQKYCRIIGCNFSRGLREFVQDKLRK